MAMGAVESLAHSVLDQALIDHSVESCSHRRIKGSSYIGCGPGCKECYVLSCVLAVRDRVTCCGIACQIVAYHNTYI